MRSIFILFLSLLNCYILSAQVIDSRETIDLNGVWQFEQTVSAFPPQNFTRTIPVPGLIHLANPKIEEYEKFFQRPDKSEEKAFHSAYDINYTPKYSWYRKSLFLSDDYEGIEAVLKLLKSQYVTTIIVNGHDFGTYMECYTPIEANITRALKYNAENEILIRVGDRMWLPAEAAGSTDKEKEHYLPGIWDDVTLSFTNKIRINRLLVLPNLKNKNITVKLQLRNFFPSQLVNNDPKDDSITVGVSIFEKVSGKKVGSKTFSGLSRRDNISILETTLNIPSPTPWTPDDPFLYTARAEVIYDSIHSDVVTENFGMRDFTRKGKFFYLNDKKTYLRGTNVTIHRFFEDPDCGDLIWNREWVKKLLIDYPKEMNWNAMRICVGIVPDFWYDLADEYGIMFQNEWMYWQNHGWDDQIRKEYTDWVWSDGNHPSIVIWDAINENWDDYIGNHLIPELTELDPTRIWDSGYMTAEQLTTGKDDMDEPHPYAGPRIWMNPDDYKSNPYPLGNLDFRNRVNLKSMESSAVQLVNEYGWIWLWRNGEPSKLTVFVYDYYLGANASASERRELQAYWLQLETEWLRSVREHAGVLSFCYLANNYGYTGDWFINDIADLEPGPTLSWFKHAFAPAGVFINLTDERYTKFTAPHERGSEFLFSLTGINDHEYPVKGITTLKLFNSEGAVVHKQEISTILPPDIKKDFPVKLDIPEDPGGYLLIAEFLADGDDQPVISRRYLNVGELNHYKYYTYTP